MTLSIASLRMRDGVKSQLKVVQNRGECRREAAYGECRAVETFLGPGMCIARDSPQNPSVSAKSGFAFRPHNPLPHKW